MAGAGAGSFPANRSYNPSSRAISNSVSRVLRCSLFTPDVAGSTAIDCGRLRAVFRFSKKTSRISVRDANAVAVQKKIPFVPDPVQERRSSGNQSRNQWFLVASADWCFALRSIVTISTWLRSTTCWMPITWPTCSSTTRSTDPSKETSRSRAPTWSSMAKKSARRRKPIRPSWLGATSVPTLSSNRRGSS